MALWLAGQALVLASKSEIRRAILASAGIPVEVVAADIDERAIEQRATTRDAGEIAAMLAREKSRAIAARAAGGWCLAQIRRLRSASGVSRNQPTGERRASSSRLARANA